MSSAAALTRKIQSDPKPAADAPCGLFARPWNDYSFSVFASFWQKAGLKKAVCWSYENFSWTLLQAVRCAFREIRPAFACRSTYVPGTRCNAAPSPVSGANRVLRMVV